MLLIRKQICLRFRYFFLTVTIVPFIFAGCVNTPKTHSQKFKVHFGKVGILSISSPSQLTFSPYAVNIIAGAVNGATDGMLLGLTEPEILFDFLFALCWPIAAGTIISIMGISSIAGGVYGATHTIPPNTAKSIEQKLRESRTISELSKELADRIYEFSSSEVGFGKYEIVRLGTFISEKSLAYETFTKLGIENVLIIKLKEANIIAEIKEDHKLLFYLLAEVGLVKTKDGTLIFKKDYSYDGESSCNQECLLDGVKPLSQSLDEAAKSLAFRIINDIFIINSFPFDDDTLSTKIDRPEYGSSWFYPIYPKIQYQTPTSKKIIDENEKGNVAYNKNIVDTVPSENQIKLAILPFHFYKGHVKYAGPIMTQTIDAIGEALKANDKFYPSYSYYDLGHGLDVRVIDDENISINSPDKLWTDKKLGTKKPNVNLSCEIGKELDVNLVFLGSVVAASEYEYDIDFYLIDVTSEKIYKRSDKIAGTRLSSDMKLFAKQYFRLF